MTAHQLANFALAKIRNKVDFDDENTSVKVTYLGQLKKEHFFLLTITPVNARTNEKAVKTAVNILNTIGFKDTHWIHTLWDESDKYHYYCYIEDSTMMHIN